MNRSIARAASVVCSLLLLAACASSPKITPSVTLEQLSAPPDVQVRPSTGGLPVEYRVTVHNPLEHAVTLVSIEVETVGGSGGYQMKRLRHDFSRVIQPKANESVNFRAWVQPLSEDSRGDVNSPVLLRGTARFDTHAGPVRTNFVTRGQ